MLKVGEMVLPKEGHINRLSSAKWSTLKQDIYTTFHILNMFWYICIYNYTYVYNKIGGKTDHEFGGVMGGVCRWY